MADELYLSVQPRQVIGKQVRQLRRAGWIPLALYGADMPPQSLQAEERALRTVLTKAGLNRLIRLDLGDGNSQLVITREIQREPITGRLLHVDLQRVSLTEKMELDVPVVFKGTAPAVQRGEGLLIHGLDHITIRVLPADLIPEIVVDISGLEHVNQALYVSDLQVSDKIEILTAPDEMIAKIIPIKEEVVATEAPTATAEVEVVGKGKKEAAAEPGEGSEEK